MAITLHKLHCRRCDYRWYPRPGRPMPKVCPECKSSRWQTKAINRQGKRPEGWTPWTPERIAAEEAALRKRQKALEARKARLKEGKS